MNNNVKLTWLAALRSGKYKQGQSHLRTHVSSTGTDEYCCLGVLCDLLEPDGWARHQDRDDGAQIIYHGEVSCIPNSDILARADLEYDFAMHLAHLNDKGFTFGQMAEIIEELA